MLTGTYPDAAGFVDSPGFGALIALAGTLITFGGAIWVF
jgi:hypothetical protein